MDVSWDGALFEIRDLWPCAGTLERGYVRALMLSESRGRSPSLWIRLRAAIPLLPAAALVVWALVRSLV